MNPGVQALGSATRESWVRQLFRSAEDVAPSINWGLRLVDVLITRALLFGVYKLPRVIQLDAVAFCRKSRADAGEIDCNKPKLPAPYGHGTSATPTSKTGVDCSS